MESLFYPGGENLARTLDKNEKELLDFINSKIASGTILRDVIQFLFDTIQPMIPCDRIGVAFLEENEQRLVLYTVVSRYTDLYITEGYSADIEGSSLKRIFDSDKPRVINDLEEYARVHPDSESTSLLLKEEIHSSMTCPLKVEGRPVGLLFLSARDKNAYNEKQVAFQMAISERLSQAVDKSYIIEQLTGSINSYLEMLGFVTHELRSPLHTIITVANTMLAGYFGSLDDKQKEMIGRIVERAEQLGRTVDDYLNLSRFENNTIQPSLKNTDILADVIEPSIAAIEPQIHASDMRLEKNVGGSLPGIACDPELMKIVMGNLLSNAVKYGKEGGLIRVSLVGKTGSISVSVWNEGPGFPLHEKKRLFRKFSRIMTPELSNKKGTGIGLYTCWKIVKLHGGTMRADSSEGAWAEFSFTLPVK